MGSLVKNNRNLFPAIPSFFDNNLMGDWLNWPFASNQERSSVPAVNVKETDKAFELKVAAPGMDKNDFKVELENNMLVISAQKEDKHEEQDEQGNYTRREFSYQSFQRSFNLPEQMVQGDKISAKYKDGVLSITVPKTEEAKAKPAKRIQIS
jgi:HSP20 family protein